MSSTTVRRNASKLRAQIRADYTEAYAHALSTDFAAQPVKDLDAMWDQCERSRNAVLYRTDSKGQQHYVISIHSNLWYELYKPGTKS